MHRTELNRGLVSQLEAARDSRKTVLITQPFNKRGVPWLVKDWLGIYEALSWILSSKKGSTLIKCSHLELGPNRSMGGRGEKGQCQRHRHLESGLQQTCLFSNGERLLYPPPSTQAAFQSVDIAWSPLIG